VTNETVNVSCLCRGLL